MTPIRTSVSRSWRPGMWEVAIAAVAVALSLRVLGRAEGGDGFRDADALGYALTAVGAGATLWAQRQPFMALLVSGGCVTCLAWLDYHVDVLPFVLTGLLFMVGFHLGRRTAVVGLALTWGLLAVSAASRPADLGPQIIVQSVLIFSAAWALGRAARARRDDLISLVAAADHRAESERRLAAAEQDHQALLAFEERLRIARELHDVLAHSISVITVQATVGEHLATDDPAAARRALSTIGEVSRASMDELRQMLALLRHDRSPDAPPDTGYEPAKGLTDLETLVDTFRAAGLAVSTTSRGVARHLGPAADLCAYRIVQEALTNTLKHAGASTAAVMLRYDADQLLVTVTDDGRGVVAMPDHGHGLVGMRERTRLLGGRLEAGAGADGGFTVTATIPYAPVVREPVG